MLNDSNTKRDAAYSSTESILKIHCESSTAPSFAEGQQLPEAHRSSVHITAVLTQPLCNDCRTPAKKGTWYTVTGSPRTVH